MPGYRLDGRLGAGGSAVVWAATREEDRRAVAIKVVPLDPGAAVARELAALTGLEVEHVVRVLEVVAIDVPAPAVALVLDRLDGGTLSELVTARGHLTPGEVVTVAAPVASALGAVHALGIVHGDVSPSNILFDTPGRPVLADLGLAGIVGEVRSTVEGTEGYVPPEVLRGDPRTGAGDVYSLGAVMWFCLTGEPPAPSPIRPQLADMVPGVPSALSRVVQACLSADPAARPAASAVALEVYDSTAAEPLRLRTDEDLASGVTRRIRSTAQTSSSSGLWDDPVPSGPPTRPAGAVAVRRAAARSSIAAPPRGALVAVAVALGLATGLVIGGSGAPGGTRAPLPGGASPGPAQPPLTAVDTAPVDDARGLLTVLSRARARAWNAEDLTALGRVDAPGSPALSADRRRLGTAVAAGVDYDGVDFTVRDAHLVSYEGERAAVGATVRTGAYRVSWPDGTVQSRAATPGRPVVVDLVLRAGTWRVHRVREP